METCPRCLTQLVSARGYSRTIGVEVWEVYDGVLYWQCPDCGYCWPREFGIETRDRQARVAAEEANERLAPS